MVNPEKVPNGNNVSVYKPSGEKAALEKPSKQRMRKKIIAKDQFLLLFNK